MNTLYFLNGISFFMEKLMYFHDTLLIMCYFVIFFIFSLMVSMILFSGKYFYKLHKMYLEMGWTIMPSFILIYMVEPSLTLLYFSEAFNFNKSQIMKVEGHQWYWSFKSDLLKKIDKKKDGYDSYLQNDLVSGDFRLLEVDLPAVAMAKVPIYFFVSSTDVIHSFALPALGMKIDAFPGRLKTSVSSGLDVGCYWGQCSEICGANHAFMPMGLEVLIYF